MPAGDEIFFILAHFHLAHFLFHFSKCTTVVAERCKQVMKYLFSLSPINLHSFSLSPCSLSPFPLEKIGIFSFSPFSLSLFSLDTFTKLAHFHSVSFSLSQCREVHQLCFFHSANYLLLFSLSSFLLSQLPYTIFSLSPFSPI